MAETNYEFVENVGFQPVEEPVETPRLFFNFPQGIPLEIDERF